MAPTQDARRPPRPARPDSQARTPVSSARRTIVRSLGGALTCALVLPSLPGSGWSAQSIRQAGLFTLGVASGDPHANGFTLWTRLAPNPLDGGGMGDAPVEVLWEVASDPDMVDVIVAGLATAHPSAGHAINVPIVGLAADRWYFYRFSALGEQSRIGRTRTFPAPGTPVEHLRFALASCQHYQDGYFAAYRDIVARDDLDFVLHVGDYIYESAANPRVPLARRHLGGELHSLQDYRDRYALYRLDPHLQDAHAAYPFIVTWDDHEVDNNYAGLVPEAAADGPSFARRRRNAYRAYRESMPLSPRVRLAQDGSMAIFRRLQYGNLATLHLVDTRQYRSDQPCDDRFPALAPLCSDAMNATAATLTGTPQERWLHTGLRDSTSTWNVIAQQVMLMQWDVALTKAFGGAYNADAWDGYPAARQRLLNFIAAARPNNPIVLSGDIHSAWAADLKHDFSDANSQILGAEFVCTAITSRFPDALSPLLGLTVSAGNPHIRYFEGRHRGYCVCDVDDTRWRTDFQAVERSADPVLTVANPDLPVRTIASWAIRAGEAGLTSST
ncbi:MAG: alkaline phosphatase D family protein [Pseudomonadota bacterium]